MKIGIFGLGTVGQGLVDIIRQKKSDLQIAAVVDRSFAKKEQILQGIPASADKDFILKDESIDTVVELMGGIDDSLYIVRSAIEAGKNVVTANKALLAEHGYSLFHLAHRMADKGSPRILYEAAVAGAIPIIRNIDTIFRNEQITRLMGIINGTTNYILTRMRKESLNYGDVLEAAQKQGLAEADPTLDVGGYDAQQKLALLLSLITGKWVEAKNIPVRGITELSSQDVVWAERFQNRIRLVADYTYDNGQHYMHVTPALVDERNVLYDIEYENNAILFHGEYSGEHLFMGKGAGKYPTAFSVYSDLLTLKSQAGCALPQRELSTNYLAIGDIADTSSSFYLRLRVKDQPGVLAAVAQILGNNALSIASVHQDHSAVAAGEVDIVIHTHSAKRSGFYKALQEIKNLKNFVLHQVYLPVLR
ncbi:MAG TPA: homoserine dehydrogenase [Turneriella sp.]|nr:homoserine dehydrogenase [Turneriella sp.]